jgi:hypothetical protein
MSQPNRFILTIVLARFRCLEDSSDNVGHVAEAKPAWQLEWDNTVKAAEEEGAVALFITGAFEPVFREAFQKKFPEIKATLVTGRDPTTAH